MAFSFNIGAAIGGFAAAGSKRLDQVTKFKADKLVTDEERKWQIATEGRADARARKLIRDTKRDKAGDMLSTLQSLGFTLPQAEGAIAGGQGVYDIYKNVGTKAFEKGEDVASLLTLNNDSIEETDRTIGGTATNNIVQQGLGAYKWNTESVASLFGTVPKPARSLDLQLAQNASDQLANIQGTTTEKSTAKMAVLKKAEEFLLKKLADQHEAEREKNDSTSSDKPTLTSQNTLETIITKNHADSTKQYGLGINMETNIEIAFKGNEGNGYAALLSSVYKLEKSIGTNNDAWVNTRLAQERKSIERGLDAHARNIMKQGKAENYTSMDAYSNAINDGTITKLGSVASVNGVVYVYTGVPNELYKDPDKALIYISNYGTTGDN